MRKLDNYYRNRETKLTANKKYRQRLRQQVFEAYGGTVCACCGDTHEEFLTIDHINGDGADHRREIGKSTYKLHLWLKNSGFPGGFRILCMNCNFSFGMRGYCPHDKEQKMSEEGMSKYGVDAGVGDQEKLEKQAAEGCPECGQKPVLHGKVLACPSHGTEPFEKK